MTLNKYEPSPQTRLRAALGHLHFTESQPGSLTCPESDGFASQNFRCFQGIPLSLQFLFTCFQAVLGELGNFPLSTGKKRCAAVPTPMAPTLEVTGPWETEPLQNMCRAEAGFLEL